MHHRFRPVCTNDVPRLHNLAVFENGIRNIGIFSIRNQFHHLDLAVDVDTLLLYPIREYAFDDGLGAE